MLIIFMDNIVESFFNKYTESDDSRFESWLAAKQAEGKYTKQKHYFAKSKGYTNLNFDDWCRAGFEKYGKNWKAPETITEPDPVEDKDEYEYSEWDLALYAAYLEIKPVWDSYIKVDAGRSTITPHSSDWYYKRFWFDHMLDKELDSKLFDSYATEQERAENYTKPRIHAKAELFDILESMGYGSLKYSDYSGEDNSRYTLEHDWENPDRCCFIIAKLKKSKVKELLEIGKSNDECIAFATEKEQERRKNKKKFCCYKVDFNDRDLED